MIILLSIFKLKNFKKLVIVSTTLTLITNTKKIALKKVLYIYYLACFQKNSYNIKALINFDTRINTIIPTCTLKLGP